ncbi:MAG: TRAP transporter small permease subunit [Gammaproteobacteria bacterium]|nr:TRAP transporter small permease subunit [Gammaproteobacteria bacterium]
MVQRLPRFLHYIEDGALIAALVSMLSMALLQIVLRNFFGTSLLWIEPFVRILVLWIAVLGAMVATRQGNHISIDVVARYVPRVSNRSVRSSRRSHRVRFAW